MPSDGRARRSMAVECSAAHRTQTAPDGQSSRTMRASGRPECSVSLNGGVSLIGESTDSKSMRQAATAASTAATASPDGPSSSFHSLFSQLMNGLGRLAYKHDQEVAKLQRETAELRKRLMTRGSLLACNVYNLEGGPLSTQKIEEDRRSQSSDGTGKDDEDLDSVFSVEICDLAVPSEREPVEAEPNLQQRIEKTRFSGFGQETDGQVSCSMMLGEFGSMPHGADKLWNKKGSFEWTGGLPSLQGASTAASWGGSYGSRASNGSISNQASSGLRSNFAMKKPWSENPELWGVMLSEELLQNGFRNTETQLNLKMTMKRASIDSCGTASDTDFFFNIFHGLHSTEKFMFNPYKRVRSVWLLLGAFFMITDIVMLPVDLCFEYHSNSFSRAWQLVPLVYWTLDIPFTFMTGFVKYGQLEMSLDKVARNYAKTWLSIDLFLVGPEWIISFLSAESISSSLVLKFARFLRFLRIAKLRPQIRRSAMYTYIWNTRMGPFKEIVKSTAALFFGIHVLGCAWHALGDVPESGWVHRNSLDSASASWRYVVSLNWACRRLHGISSEMHLDNSREYVLDAFIIFSSVIVVASYIGQTTALSIARTNSITHSLKRLGREYVRRYRVTPSVRAKLEQFLSARRMEVAAVSANELRFLQELPSELREDLLYEARVPTLRAKQIFSDMAVTNSRALRRVCATAISVVTAVCTEVIFETGDACSRMLFPTSGAFLYKCTGREDEVLGKRAALCEAVLWTNWEHRGKLEATEESMLLALDGIGFGDVMVQYRSAHIHAAKYARRFIWHLNNLVFVASEAMCTVESLPLTTSSIHQSNEDAMPVGARSTDRLWSVIHDLIDFSDMAIWNLDQELFDGEPNDHFVFISHYKVEAGTEATLIRDLFEQVLRHDPLHPAHNLMSPVFVDSEDLEDLACLQDHVKKSSNLLLLLTPGFLSRPWCLLEIIIALRSGVDIIPVEIQRPGLRYQFPDEEFYAQLLNGKFLDDSATDLLYSQGIQLREVEQAIRQVFNKIAAHFSPHKTKQVREAELADILKRCSRTCHSGSVLRPSV